MFKELPYGINSLLPPDKEINASLLISKYAAVKTAAEKEASKQIAERSCKGKVDAKHLFHYAQMPRAKSIAMKLCDRLIVDQSGGIQENANLCLHSHFGVPMIPGSAVKGTARHFLWEQWREAEDKKVDRATELIEIFGYPTGDSGLDKWCKEQVPDIVLDSNGKSKALAGRITFFAALPIGAAPLAVDVLTCHHPDYYSPGGRTVATDDESPIPVFFPVVKKGATFEFTVQATKRGSDSLAETALSILKEALEINGIGAKTAAGYGWFEEDAELREKRERAVYESGLKDSALEFLNANQTTKEALLNEGEFSEVVARVLDSGSDDEKMVLVALLKTGKASYLKKQHQLAAKGKKGPARRVEAIQKIVKELEELFE